MNPPTVSPARPRVPASSQATGVGRWLQGLLIAAAGILIGQQYVFPDKRMIPLLISVVVVGITWRLDMLAGISLLIVALPFPRGTVFGTTNIAFILMLVIFWLVRVSTRQLAAPRRSPIDLPLIGLFIVYILSFSNVRDPIDLDLGLRNLILFVGSVFMYFLITNNVHDERGLKRLHDAQLFSALTIFLLGLWELNHPGQDFIPGWFGFQHTIGTDFGTRNVRIGSAFFDYELLSEYSALTLLLAGFRWARARSNNERSLYTLFMVLNVFILFATVTRGAILSLLLSLPVLLWSIRRRLKVVPLTIAACAGLALFLGMNFMVSHFTRSGDLLGRLEGTKLVGGWMPDSRADAWTNAWARAWVHPLVGKGPHYGTMFGFEPTWPHNVYLYYANIVGFIGLAFFLIMMFRFWQMTRPRTDDLVHGPYAESFLIIAHVQFALFAINEFKIDYLRNPTYQIVVWAMFSVWTAAYKVARNPAAGSRAPAS
ncbi:MAG: hypothetical protein IT347_09240 [Candidatus Eisenbacteria bacterium]|nr:hypothetical protein [Candidatus Eisenbacteria bacterium]